MSRMQRTIVTLGLPLRLERESALSLERQLTDQLRQAILKGLLVPGTRLPSTRALAAELHVSRTVTFATYERLFAEGYLCSQTGSGTYVSDDIALNLQQRVHSSLATGVSASSSRRGAMYGPVPGRPRWLKPEEPRSEEEAIPAGMISFRVGATSLSSLPDSIWRTIWREVAAQPLPTDYGDPAGDVDLRASIAGYLGRSRGIACHADDIVITAGSLQALDLLARATITPGDPVGVEEPGYPTARAVFRAYGAHLYPLPVDDDGLRVDLLPSSVGTSCRGPIHGARPSSSGEVPLLVYVTPSHHFPLGMRLSVARRLALLEWARANDSLIIEDDYDGEFRFDVAPLPALAELDPLHRVAYLGTFSKVLTPALRCGYLVAPPLLRQRVKLFKYVTDYHVPWPVQRALHILLTEGHLERHIRRVRQQYAEKRQLLSKSLEPVSHLARLQGLEAGLHAFLELTPALDPLTVARAAYRRGIQVVTGDEYYQLSPTKHGLVLGYGALEPQQIEQGVRILVEVMHELSAKNQIHI
jgi:GntR family transcriptional regulator/MocR family aminotransferase